MNDVDNSLASSKLRTPVYANFDYNTTKIDRLLRFMHEGVKGIGEQVFRIGETLVNNLRKNLAKMDYRSGIANDVILTDQLGILTTAHRYGLKESTTGLDDRTS